MNKDKTIAIDFDGTIATKNDYDPHTINATPNKGVHSALEKLSKDYTVMIYTTRLSPSQNGDTDKFLHNTNLLVDWLDLNDFIRGVHYHGMTGVKLPAKYYIDDHAIRFTNWNQVIGDIHGLDGTKETS